MSDELKKAVNKNKIHTMDCIEGMRRRLGRESVDVVVTSPPYNIGKKYNKYSDNMSRDMYIIWMDESFTDIVITDEGFKAWQRGL